MPPAASVGRLQRTRRPVHCLNCSVTSDTSVDGRAGARKELKKPHLHLGVDCPSGGTPVADAGSAGVGPRRLESKLKPIEIIMACAAGRISIGEWS